MIAEIYPFILPIHITSAFTVLTLVVATDIYGSVWLLGKRETLSASWLHRLHLLVWTMLLLMISTGALLFAPYKSYLLTDPAFLIKMGFIGALVVNALFIGQHIHVASKQSFKSLPTKTKVFLLISGAASTAGWVGTFVAAQFIGL